MPNPRSFSVRVQLVETTDDAESAEIVLPLEPQSATRVRVAHPRSPEFRELKAWNHQAQQARLRRTA